MKDKLIRILHLIFGWENYLFVFTVFKIRTLALDKRKKDYLFFTKQFAPDANIMIIGACTGITTVPVAQQVPQGKVIAFEPVPANYKTIERALRYFKLRNVQLLQLALGDANGSIEMVLPVLGKTKKQGYAHVLDASITEYNEGIRFPVPLKKLDDIQEISTLSIRGLKVVAENYEKQIFTGAKEFILKNRPLIYCELWDNPKRKEVLQLVRSWGYVVMINDSDKLVPYDPAVHKEKFFFFVYE